MTDCTKSSKERMDKLIVLVPNIIDANLSVEANKEIMTNRIEQRLEWFFEWNNSNQLILSTINGITKIGPERVLKLDDFESKSKREISVTMIKGIKYKKGE